MTTANESKLGGARGGHRGPIVLRVAAARVLPLLPVAARGARLVLSMGPAAGCVRARVCVKTYVCVCDENYAEKYAEKKAAPPKKGTGARHRNTAVDASSR